jgi:putative intracellular protease/amidase/YHS domain-containing protein
MKCGLVSTASLLVLFFLTAPTPGGDGDKPPSSGQQPVVALKGLDAVALVGGKEVAGDPKHASSRGRFLYQFVSAENKAAFDARPEKYEIQLDGQCAHSPAMKGNPDLFTVHDGKIYIGGSQACVEAFAKEPAAHLRRHAERKNVAILIFQGVQIIDYTGPYEVFGQAGCHVFTVAERSEPITTNMGMIVTPNHTFADCPRPDIIVLPGGRVRSTPAINRWIKENIEQTTHTLSVCNGAFYLAKLGLLDGLSATTFYGLLDQLQQQTPKAKVVWDERFVDNGKIITAAGLSSGIDGALHVVEKIYGKGTAQQIALGMEYNWQPEAGYARAKFADMHLLQVARRGFDLPDGATWKVHSTQGDADHWEKVWEIHTDKPSSDLLKMIEAKLEKGWKKVAAGGAGTHSSSWQFADQRGRNWKAVCTVDAMPGSEGALRLAIRLDRDQPSAQK